MERYCFTSWTSKNKSRASINKQIVIKQKTSRLVKCTKALEKQARNEKQP